MMMKQISIIVLLFIFMFCVGAVFAGSEQKIEAFTKPCEDVTLSFIQPGSIEKINYKEGETVQIDNVLIKLEDSVEQIKLEQLKALSEDETSIKHAQITEEQRRVDLQRLENIPDATNKTEIEYAKLNLKVAELQSYIANFQHTQAKLKYKEAQKQIDRMSLTSPIDGIIEKITKEKGESVNALEEVIRIVRIDPLLIDVEVKMSQAAKLRNGGKAIVEFPEPIKKSEEGRIIFISSVGAGVANSLTVRVQVPNKTNRPARESVMVSFPTN